MLGRQRLAQQRQRAAERHASQRQTPFRQSIVTRPARVPRRLSADRATGVTRPCENRDRRGPAAARARLTTPWWPPPSIGTPLQPPRQAIQLGGRQGFMGDRGPATRRAPLWPQHGRLGYVPHRTGPLRAGDQPPIRRRRGLQPDRRPLFGGLRRVLRPLVLTPHHWPHGSGQPRRGQQRFVIHISARIAARRFGSARVGKCQRS